MPEEFVVANDLDLAWSNFDPFFPLPADCPFHVEREGKPLNKLIRALLREHRQPPKYFFSGHRGCGIERIGHLLHNLSVLEYTNDDMWCDIHPTLEELLRT